MQLVDGRDPLWDEADALDDEDAHRITQALAALPEDERPPHEKLEQEVQALGEHWLKRRREQQQQQHEEEEKEQSNKRQAVAE